MKEKETILTWKVIEEPPLEWKDLFKQKIHTDFVKEYLAEYACDSRMVDEQDYLKDLIFYVPKVLTLTRDDFPQGICDIV